MPTWKTMVKPGRIVVVETAAERPDHSTHKCVYRGDGADHEVAAGCGWTEGTHPGAIVGKLVPRTPAPLPGSHAKKA